MPSGFDTVGGLGPLQIAGQVGLGLNSKDHSTHKALIFPDWNFLFFSRGKYCVLNLECGESKGLEN